MGERATGAVDRGGRLPGQAVWFDWDRLLARLPAGGQNQAVPEGAADLPTSLFAPFTAAGPVDGDADVLLFGGFEPIPSAEAAGWRLRLRETFDPNPWKQDLMPGWGALACRYSVAPQTVQDADCSGCNTLGAGATLCWADRGLVVHRRGPQLPGEPAGATAVPRALPSGTNRMAAPCRERSGPARRKAIPVRKADHNAAGSPKGQRTVQQGGKRAVEQQQGAGQGALSFIG